MTKAQVLLADDHALVRAGIRNALQELPDLDIVSEVGDGPALLAALDTFRLDLLLVDLNMPDFEPLAALRQIRARYPRLCILVISAYDDDVYVQGLLSAGVNGYHLKDQPLSDLKLAVQRVLAGERWISSPLLEKLVNYTRAPAPSASLTTRQRDLLRLLQQGCDNQSIAQRLGLSVKTVENHLTRLYRQLGVQSRLEAVNLAAQRAELLGLSGSAAQADSGRREPALHPATQPAEQSPAAFNVLLVDDNARYRGQLRRMIARVCPQATLYEAEDVGEALQLAERLLPHLAFVDVVLGDEDGIRCVRRLKAVSPASRVVLISAYPDREFRRMGQEAGASAFLDKKDLDASVLRHIIDDVAR